MQETDDHSDESKSSEHGILKVPRPRLRSTKAVANHVAFSDKNKFAADNEFEYKGELCEASRSEAVPHDIASDEVLKAYYLDCFQVTVTITKRRVFVPSLASFRIDTVMKVSEKPIP